MRIIIETTEQTSVVHPNYEPKASDNVETTDVGAPSETLVNAIEVARPESTEREETDSGAPARWLLEAVGGTESQPSTEGDGMDTDAGSSPSTEV